MVALSFAELAGRYPVAGSVYNWSKSLAGGATAWLAGWMMLTASVVTISAVVLAYQLVLPQIWSGFQLVGDAADGGDAAVNGVLLGVVLIVFTTVINAIGMKLMAQINSSGVFIELIAAVLIVVILGFNIVNPPSVLFDTQGLGAGEPGGYFGVFLVAALASAYVMYGFDTASSLGEETVDPRRTAPTAILRAVIASFIIGGLILLFCVLAAPDLADPALGQKSGGGQLILLQVMGGTLGTIFLISITIAITVCALAVHTAAIRLMFAMARDNALPAGATLAKIDPVRKTPVIPAVLVGVIAILILVANAGVPEVFTAVTSVAIIMIYIAYLLVTVPLLRKRLRGRDRRAWPAAATSPSAGGGCRSTSWPCSGASPWPSTWPGRGRRSTARAGCAGSPSSSSASWPWAGWPGTSCADATTSARCPSTWPATSRRLRSPAERHSRAATARGDPCGG